MCCTAGGNFEGEEGGRGEESWKVVHRVRLKGPRTEKGQAFKEKTRFLGGDKNGEEG